MECIEHTPDTRPLVEEATRRFGYAPEHNVFDFEYSKDEGARLVIGRDAATGECVLAHVDEDRTWHVGAEPLAAHDHRAGILKDFVEYIFEHEGAHSIEFELFEETRKDFLKVLPNTFIASEPDAVLEAPVFELARFDPTMRGNAYKKIRSVVQQFYAAHAVDIVPAIDTPHEEVLAVIHAWAKDRTAHDEAYTTYYDAFCENNFPGVDSIRVVRVEGKACALNGGWLIPNSNTFYNAFSLHDYSYSGLGDVIMVEALSYLKNLGYAYVDYGAGEKALTNFKKRFGPAYFYRAYQFSITQK